MKQFLFFALLLLISCNSGTNQNLVPYSKERTTVNSKAIKEYVEDVNDPLNPEWKFKVELYEQKESLKYELRFQYKEVTGEKIFSLPNMGFMPKPELKKGPEPLSCIVGFYNADSVFMELRIVKVENDNLVYKHLKEYKVEEEKK